MKRYIVFVFSVFVLNIYTLNAQEILSPNKIIKVILVTKKISDNNTSEQVFFRIMYKKDSGYVEVLPNSPLGISREDQQFVDNFMSC